MLDLGELETIRAAIEPTDSSPRIGWAWNDEGYRRSGSRAFGSRAAPLTVTDAGIGALERLVDDLLSSPRSRELWRPEDLWTSVLSLLESQHGGGSDLRRALAALEKPEPARHLAALANVSWASEPATLGVLVLGRTTNPGVAQQLVDRIGLPDERAEVFTAQLGHLARDLGAPVVVSGTSRKQGELGHEEFQRRVEDLLALLLLVSERLRELRIHAARGATNRPGLRGLVLDRSGIENRITDEGRAELGASILEMTGWGAGRSMRWYSAEPLPLDQLVDPSRWVAVGDLLTANDPIAQRLRVAARWFERAVWASAVDDSALAVSVALDSLLTGKEAVPGAVSKSRFALLEREVAKRPERFKRYDAVYHVRSAIAHGGEAERGLRELGGADSLLADAQWVARQLLALRELKAPQTEGELRELWAALQWGTVEWAS